MNTAQRTMAPPELRQHLADPAVAASSPGEEFAQAANHNGIARDVTVPFRTYLPAAFPLFAERPRYTVRQLLKVATIRDEAWPYVFESHTGDGRTGGTSYEATPEAGFTAAMRSAGLTDISVLMTVPAGLLSHPRLTAAFVDYRVLVRLGVRENQTLLHGDGDGVIPGLLTLPGLRRIRTDRGLVEQLTTAAAAVEETGGSCDAIVAHPSVYWRAVECGLLGRLAEAGIRIARTRMMPRDKVLLGDFAAAVTRLDPEVSSITLRRHPGGNTADVIEARSRIGLAVHLPQHFVLLEKAVEESS